MCAWMRVCARLYVRARFSVCVECNSTKQFEISVMKQGLHRLAAR